MSDLASAAAALGLPEPLVKRSAEARAAETGASIEEIYAQWAGGEAAPLAAPAPTAVPETETTPEAPVEETAPSPPEVVIEVPGEPAPAPPTAAAPAGPYRPPVLVGTKDNPMTVLAGVIGLFIIVFMVGLVGPSLPTESPGARTSDIDFSETAALGQQVFLVTGCASCHTQMVRPVVADVGLGPVTLDDTDQVLGTRRFGPDLSDIGARVTAAQIEAIIDGLGEHPAHDLDQDDLTALVTYLTESVTSGGGEGS